MKPPEAGLWDHPPAQALYQILADNAVDIPGPEAALLGKWAAGRGVYLIRGLHERWGGTLYNTTLTCTPQGALFLHRKLMPTYTERLVWGMGDGSTLGGFICWEHWMPLARATIHAQNERIHTAQWPTVRELHQVASRHYAFEGQCFVLAAGTALTKGDALDGFDSLGLGDGPARGLLSAIPGQRERLLQRGGSGVIGPDGEYVAGPLFDESAIIHAELDLAAIPRGHLALNTDGHYARPDIFHLRVNDLPQVGVRFRSQEREP